MESCFAKKRSLHAVINHLVGDGAGSRSVDGQLDSSDEEMNTEEKKSGQPVCARCKGQCPMKMDVRKRYWCSGDSVRMQTTLRGRCPADWKHCTCRLGMQYVCPEERCEGRIPHDADKDKPDRAMCKTFGEQVYFPKLACERCLGRNGTQAVAEGVLMSTRRPCHMQWRISKC